MDEIPARTSWRIAGTAELRGVVLPDGRLDFRKVMEGFAGFWKADGALLQEDEACDKVAAQFITLAYLQRVADVGGLVDRDYAVGRSRLDLLVRKPCTSPGGKPILQKEAIQLKVRTEDAGDPLDEGLAELDGYLARMSLDSGTLLIFDRRPSAVRPRIEATFSQALTPEGREITVLRADWPIAQLLRSGRPHPAEPQ